MRGTLTSYGIWVFVIHASLNGVAWLVRSPRLHEINVFSAGFILGMLGTCLAVYLYDIARFPDPASRHDPHRAALWGVADRGWRQPDPNMPAPTRRLLCHLPRREPA